MQSKYVVRNDIHAFMGDLNNNIPPLSMFFCR